MSEWIFIRTGLLFFLAAKSKQLGREQHMWETWKPASFSATLRATAFSVSQWFIKLSHEVSDCNGKYKQYFSAGRLALSAGW
jgi:hypothetical protein